MLPNPVLLPALWNAYTLTSCTLLAGAPTGCCAADDRRSFGLQTAQQPGVPVGLLLLSAC